MLGTADVAAAINSCCEPRISSRRRWSTSLDRPSDGALRGALRRYERMCMPYEPDAAGPRNSEGKTNEKQTLETKKHGRMHV